VSIDANTWNIRTSLVAICANRGNTGNVASQAIDINFILSIFLWIFYYRDD